MSGKRNAKLLQAVLATAPVVLLFSNTARGTATWVGGASDSWGDPANWVGTAPIPPGVAAVASTPSQGDAWIGNNGSVSLNGFSAGAGTYSVIGRLHLG